jgi:DHA2 family multidrug resistance protein-like MFS transporter
LTTSVQNQLTMSYAGAADIAAQYPQYSAQILQAAKEAFLAGDQWAYLAGIVAVLLGATLVFFKFPRKDEEQRLLAEYHEEDAAAGQPSTPPAAQPAPAPQPG